MLLSQALSWRSGAAFSVSATVLVPKPGETQPGLCFHKVHERSKGTTDLRGVEIGSLFRFKFGNPSTVMKRITGKIL